jgi:hypothetical protein
MIDGKLKTFNRFDDIPNTFDHVIEFKPEIPPPPHTEEQHEEMDKWNDKLIELMKREVCK